MNFRKITAKQRAAANQNVKEKEYWLKKLSGELNKSGFPYDLRKEGGSRPGKAREVNTLETAECNLGTGMSKKIINICNGNEKAIHLFLITGMMVYLSKYTGFRDIMVGTPIYSQKSEGEFINTQLTLRNQVDSNATFKDLLLSTRQTMVEAVEHQDYPMNILLEQLKISYKGNGFPLFDVALLLENIQKKEYILDFAPNIIFSFKQKGDKTEGELEYNPILYKKNTIERIKNGYIQILETALADLKKKIFQIDFLTGEDKKKLLLDFNDTCKAYPKDKTIDELFCQQVKRTSLGIAVKGKQLNDRENQLTYRKLHVLSNQLAGKLKEIGCLAGMLVGIFLEPTLEMVIGLLAVLKAGGAYLPIEITWPEERIHYMLSDADVKLILTYTSALKRIPFTQLQNLELRQPVDIRKTAPRSYIREFDQLPIPDRNFIDITLYKNKIGMASVENCISLQATRGCPYKCLFCHKVWSKSHVFRSAENLYREIEYYYKQGVINFSVIDDCFNLNKENSTRFFRLIIKNKLLIHLFFPNGLRGDILSTEEVDLMREAGCRGINLSLETASPRLQKLVRKYLDVDKFKTIMDYMASQHPDIILEIATMHGFPTETEEEALKTLEFIKSIQWIHFPYIHILKVYPNTEMEKLALENGISKKDILRSRNLAFHELPETLPFPKSFTRKYQSDLMNHYFLNPERLKQVLPVQQEIMGEKAMIEKYNAYLPVEVRRISDILEFSGMKEKEEDILPLRIQTHSNGENQTLFEVGITPENRIPKKNPQEEKGKKKILLLDLTQHFSTHQMLYNVTEQPLGLISLLTFLRNECGDQIQGRIYKSGIDFDSYKELNTLVNDYQPDLVGIRSLTFYREMFHETVSLLRQWGITAPIIAGGPYATSDYEMILGDRNVDLVVFGEGEYTLLELVKKIQEKDFTLPSIEELKEIKGIAYRKETNHPQQNRHVWLMDQLYETFIEEESEDLPQYSHARDLAYVMYTSGSTGKPKGVMVEHRQVNNCLFWMQDTFNLKPGHTVVQRTNLTFDPSVWEIFWPLYVGASIRVLDAYQRKDAEYLIQLMTGNSGLTMMYCPSTLVKVMVELMESKFEKPVLKMPWFLIGAEPISKETIEGFYDFFQGNIVNTYGPTECTINNTYYNLDSSNLPEDIPIGKPVANNKIYVLSEDYQLKALNSKGEICIAGDSLARGYLNQVKKTDNSFIQNPFEKGRIYLTGDVGKWKEDGNVEIQGRVDDQVKIRGYRIELGEIETALSAHEKIRDCVVIKGNKKDWEEEVRQCKKCGITSQYPGTDINEDVNCDICENLTPYKKTISNYFKDLTELKKIIQEAKAKSGTRGEYDCLLVYNGGRGAAYALYQLEEMGIRVKVITYDNGYFGKLHIKNIKKVIQNLGFDHEVLTHPHTDEILKESIRVAHTVCRGCFHISSSLAGEYASKNNIPVVMGATLSPGQIIENKLFMFIRQGISETGELEREISNLRKATLVVDKAIFDLIGIEKVSDNTVTEKVSLMDFYRYCDITNREMIGYLNHRDPYWKSVKNDAIYSTNCPIKQIGDYCHLKETGFHYYGSATSWEKRLNHLSLDNIREDLHCRITEKGYENFLKRLGITIKKEKTQEPDYLCAYIIGNKEIDIVNLREYLTGKIPDYMIPTYFMKVEEIPLSTNGKINRKALPRPEIKPQSRSNYLAPESQLEEKLVEVWEEVLVPGTGKIGTRDNFFELGGDSIKAIQIISKVQQMGLRAEIRDLFLEPTIKGFSGTIKIEERKIDQGEVQGEVRLTPIQQWYFEKHTGEEGHFNQSLLLIAKKGIHEESLNKAFRKIMEHHDALRIIFSRKEDMIKQVNRGIEGDYPVIETETILNDREPGPQILEACSRIQQRNLAIGEHRLVRLGLFKSREGKSDYLFICIHHLLVDGVSWRILLEDLDLAYQQAVKGKEIQLPGKTDSYQTWAEKLYPWSQSKKALEEYTYWNLIEQKGRELSSFHHKGLTTEESSKIKYSESVALNISKEKTQALLTEIHQVYKTEINDILLAALGMTIRYWAGTKQLLINLEGHGREAIMEDVNITRTIGWFTTQYPVLLNLSHSWDIGKQIISVKDTLRKIPQRGIGYGILKYVTPIETQKKLKGKLEPEVCFNYLGQIGIERDPGNQVFKISHLKRGDEVSPEHTTRYPLTFNGITLEGTMSFSITYNKNQYNREQVRELAGAYKTNLEKVIDYCQEKLQTKEIPKEFLEQGELTFEDLESLRDTIDLSKVEKIYGLSPMQEGMLFHTIMEPKSFAYIELGEFEIKGEVKKELLELAFKKLIQRYEILRAGIYYQDVRNPVQVILKERDFLLTYEDISQLKREEQDYFMEQYKEKEKNKGFDLTQDLLMRCALIKTGEETYWILWSFHHILMDGWCLGIIYRDLIRCYQAMQEEQPIQFEPVKPYSQYIDWLRKTDKPQGLGYWKKYLKGYKETIGLLSFKESIAENGKYQPAVIGVETNEEITKGLQKIANQTQVTINTLFQTLWGMLLMRYNNTQDVVFGVVVSGRPVEIEGIDLMVGLFINTIPCRIQIQDNPFLSELLKRVQENALTSKTFEYVPLAEIQKTTLMNNTLFDHIMIFENFPIRINEPEQRDHGKVGFQVVRHQFHEQTNYDFYIVIETGKTFSIKFHYNSLVFHAKFIETLSIHFNEMLHQCIEESGKKVRDFDLNQEQDEQEHEADSIDIDVQFKL